MNTSILQFHNMIKATKQSPVITNTEIEIYLTLYFSKLKQAPINLLKVPNTFH